MNKKVLILVLVFCGLIDINLAFASPIKQNNTTKHIIKNPANLEGYNLFIPAGVECSAILSTEINSQTAIIGQEISAILIEDFKYQDATIASAGSIFKGTITLNKKNNTERIMQIKFTTIKTPYNSIIPINAVYSISNIQDEAKTTEENNSLIIPANTSINISFDQPITLGVE